MNRIDEAGELHCSNVPRERGDEPSVYRSPGLLSFMFPASAGMNRIGGTDMTQLTVQHVPRERGDEPAMELQRYLPMATPNVPRERGDEPSEAGGIHENEIHDVPRERGDEPDCIRARNPDGLMSCSPRARG